MSGKLTLPGSWNDYFAAAEIWCKNANRDWKGHWMCRPPGDHVWGGGKMVNQEYKGHIHRLYVIQCKQCGLWGLGDANI